MSEESYCFSKSLYEDWYPHYEKFIHIDTPFLLIRSDLQAKIYRIFSEHPLQAKIFYAVKSNPDCGILNFYKKLGSFFDIASVYELNRLLQLGIPAGKISFGQTIKKSVDIRFAYEKGVRWFVSDSIEDIHSIAEEAPGSFIILRLSTSGEYSDWPLSKKFGESADVLFELGKSAKRLGLHVKGIAFHVGSQQKNITSWKDPIKACADLHRRFASVEIEIQIVNLGGGFPASYVTKTPHIEEYLDQIYVYCKEFLHRNIEIWVEPGRGLIGDCGVIVGEVVRNSQKSNQQHWLFVDVGVFSGLIETLGESIKYPIYLEGNYPQVGLQPYVISGPTCDSMDILYENFLYYLPQKITSKNRIFIFSSGAYTSSYSSVGFNGFPHLPTYVI